MAQEEIETRIQVLHKSSKWNLLASKKKKKKKKKRKKRHFGRNSKRAHDQYKKIQAQQFKKIYEKLSSYSNY